MMGILGCDPLDERWESRDETSAALAAVDVLVHAEIQRRQEARERRDWAEADAIRDRLKDAGVDVTDTADGPQWTLLDGYSNVDGRQFPASWCGSQGRHQEGPQGRLGRSAPPWAGGPRAPPRPHICGPTIRPPSVRPNRRSAAPAETH